MGCIEEFNNRLNNNEYISQFLYDNVLKYNNNIEPFDFDLYNYNDKVLSSLYFKNKDYFDNLYKDINQNIHLDEEQIKTILADEDYSLVIAGAGTGKTTTMVSKIKYLVDKKGIDPSRILAMSYTKKATEELKERIQIDFGLPVDVATFHSLGFRIIRNIFSSRHPYVIETNERRDIFLSWFKEKFSDKELIKKIIENFSDIPGYNFMFSNYFEDNYSKYNSFEEYFESYKKRKIKEAKETPFGIKGAIKEIIEKKLNDGHVYTINNELVKSKGEAIIANYLYCNNIDYEYEKVYEEIIDDNKSYKPDFTLDLAGIPVYIEYFGLSLYKDKMSTYQKIKAKKEEYHRAHNTKFIAIDYAPEERIIDKLNSELIKMGFILNPKNDEEIYNKLLENNKLAELYNFESFLYKVIDSIKSSNNRENFSQIINNYLSTLTDTKEKYEFQYKIILDFYKFYQTELYGKEKYGFDFSDMLYYGKLYMTSVNKNLIDYDYLIIDEYQDVSYERYELALELVKINNLKLTAIGDDWQTIFSFAGSKMDYIVNFEKYFPSSKLFIINKSYRNPQEIVDSAGTFIMKNDIQIKKELESNKNISNSIIFVEYEKYMDEVLKELIKEIYDKNSNDSILLLSRRNKTINDLYKGDEFIDDIDTKVRMRSIPNVKLDAMTIHKSKGLTADQVIIIDPYKAAEKEEFWINKLFKTKSKEEPIEHAEERRIFYVALTRTKNKVYIMDDISKTDDFIFELKKIVLDRRRAVIDKTTILSKEEQEKQKAIYVEDTLPENLRTIFKRLKKWRKKKSIEENVPAYMVFTNKELVNITLAKIIEKEDLLKVKGIKERKYSKYGEELYNLLMSEGNVYTILENSKSKVEIGDTVTIKNLKSDKFQNY